MTEQTMLNFRTLTRRWLPPSLKRSFQQLLLGYDSYAPSLLESNDWQRFRPKVIVVEDEQLDLRESQIVRTMNDHGYELCAQNVISLDKINEYFLIDRATN